MYPQRVVMAGEPVYNVIKVGRLTGFGFAEPSKL